MDSTLTIITRHKHDTFNRQCTACALAQLPRSLTPQVVPRAINEKFRISVTFTKGNQNKTLAANPRRRRERSSTIKRLDSRHNYAAQAQNVIDTSSIISVQHTRACTVLSQSDPSRRASSNQRDVRITESFIKGTRPKHWWQLHGAGVKRRQP